MWRKGALARRGYDAAVPRENQKDKVLICGLAWCLSAYHMASPGGLPPTDTVMRMVALPFANASARTRMQTLGAEPIDERKLT